MQDSHVNGLPIPIDGPVQWLYKQKSMGSQAEPTTRRDGASDAALLERLACLGIDDNREKHDD